MRIGIIGQPCIDELVMSDGTISKHSLGGVLYSYAAMERMMSQPAIGKLPDTNSFVGVTWMSIPDAPLIDPLLSQFHHLDHSAGLWNTQELTNRVQLVYHPVGSLLKGAGTIPERTEHCPNVLPALTSMQLTPVLLSSLDALFINMISGYDVSLKTLETALNEAERRPYVHLDIHSLVLGPLSERGPGSGDRGPGNRLFAPLTDPGSRYPDPAPRIPRGVRKWKRWLNLADSVQMNEFEARWLGDPEIKSEEELLRFIEHHRESLNVHDIIITRGKRGASLYEVRTGEVHDVETSSGFRDSGTGEMMSPYYNGPRSPVPGHRATNPTGCGDVFGSAYIFSLLSGAAPNAALEAAVRWASWNATLSSIEEINTRVAGARIVDDAPGT